MEAYVFPPRTCLQVDIPPSFVHIIGCSYPLATVSPGPGGNHQRLGLPRWAIGYSVVCLAFRRRSDWVDSGVSGLACASVSVGWRLCHGPPTALPCIMHQSDSASSMFARAQRANFAISACVMSGSSGVVTVPVKLACPASKTTCALSLSSWTTQMRTGLPYPVAIIWLLIGLTQPKRAGPFLKNHPAALSRYRRNLSVPTVNQETNGSSGQSLGNCKLSSA